MSVRTLQLPESPELNNEISVDSIRSLISKNLPDLSPIKENEIVFGIATLIGFKDKEWDGHFKKTYQTH
ncbi:hypothetical protein [Confluentibacter flavum]|uniref:Uncharacterized protein n=1 Tax=Confluentibacter flavum TaxID=1909700 RepID=A0A2N3HP41_9FLAO|nr:hypothetical protein [Confluentibacter flavum]PKQ46753.1 hypothetical protein CSW08_01220 [Confluentibacter flavum]